MSGHDIRDHHVGAFAGQSERGGLADATRGAGDDNCLTGQVARLADW